MNREEIAAQVTQALDLIGCKYRIVYANGIWIELPVSVHAGFLISNLDTIEFLFATGDGRERTWTIQITNYSKILDRIWSCLTIVSQRNVVEVHLSTPSRLIVELELWLSYRDEAGCATKMVATLDGKNDIKTFDPDLVAAARSLLLGDCPQDVFLDMLCEKYDYINELRYATA